MSNKDFEKNLRFKIYSNMKTLYTLLSNLKIGRFKDFTDLT